MNILRRTTIKFAIIAAVMLLAGVFYRCSREQTETDSGGQTVTDAVTSERGFKAMNSL